VEFSELRKQFETEFVRSGLTRTTVPARFQEVTPPRLLNRWFSRMEAPALLPNLEKPRLVNHFKVGADPEFVFIRKGVVLNPEDLSFQVGLAFGADLCGRLVELRPEADRSVLRVTASLLDSLRWMSVYYPECLDFEWIAYPLVGRDGLGGHVHFGRKKNTRKEEVFSLDRLAHYLFNGAVLNKMGQDERTKSTHYGRMGDIRPQKHGYEYRTLPSWLENPWLSFLVMTLGKLVVLHGLEKTDSTNFRQIMSNLLALYKGLDDDAAIAWHALQKFGWPSQQGLDFRGAWGIPMVVPVGADSYPNKTWRLGLKEVSLPPMIPGMIPPSEESVMELLTHLTQGTQITWRLPEPNWPEARLPQAYYPLYHHSRSVHTVGVADVIHGIVGSKKLPSISLSITDRHGTFGVGEGLAKLLKGGLKLLQTVVEKELPNRGKTPIRVYDGEKLSITLGPDLREGQPNIAGVRRVLLSGLLPFWKGSEVKTDSFEVWQKRISELGVTKENEPLRVEAGRYIVQQRGGLS
jgi:hypothetical protein